MSQEYVPSAFQHDHAYARVVQVGRWTWKIRVMVPLATDGLGLGDAEVDTVAVFGEKRAKRIARSLIERHVRKHRHWEGAFEVHRGIGDEDS